jgi:glycolate oxidase FAD binding subunit
LVALTEITFKVLPKKPFNRTIVIHEITKKEIANLFNKISNSSSEVTGSMYLPLESNNNKFKITTKQYSSLMI